jgi:hypothetical protein
MNVHKFLVTVQTDARTRFTQDPEYFRRELRALTEKLFESETHGPVPAVTVINGIQDHDPAAFFSRSDVEAWMKQKMATGELRRIDSE